MGNGSNIEKLVKMMKGKWAKRLIILICLIMLNEVLWYRGFFHQTRCYTQQIGDNSYLTILTSPPWFSGNHGDIHLSPIGMKMKADLGFDFGADYENAILTYDANDDKTGMLTLSFESGNFVGIGNITSQCWSGLKRYINQLDIEEKPVLVEK